MSLTYISQQITIYTGFLLILTGIIGNGINIFIFSRVRSYRKTPCAFYFLMASIYNIIFIGILLSSRIAISGYGVDLTRTSTAWCKMRLFIAFSITLISLSCSCLATIDQYFVTSKSVYLRHFSNIKWARRMVFIMTIVCFCHEIPMVLFYDISPITKSCINTNYAYATYHAIFIIGVICVIPCLLMTLFGYLAYRNIHLTRVLAEQQADRQLIRMILVEVVLVLISFIPYGINNTYDLITSKISQDENTLIKENFATTLFTVVYYIYFAGSCYMFLISSSRFRRAIKNRIFYYARPNQVNPTQLRTGQTVTLDKKTRH